ncbi:putative Fe(2+)-trafficking protein [Thalassocella blandensis]|nr:putative Fe(2+)-trafficking protein [Thalassocella blandensis]
MTRTVYCRKLKQELPGLPVPPMPGAKGQEIYDNVSQQAWQEWLKHQTMLINEKQLSLMDPNTRKYLGEQMEKFLSGDDYDQAEGYVPESQK